MTTSSQRLHTFIYFLSIVSLCCSCHQPIEPATTVKLADFATMQQTTDYTCGNVAALMVMRYYGTTDEDETSLAYKMHTHADSRRADTVAGTAERLTDYGTNVGEIYRYFASRSDYRIVSTSYRLEGPTPPPLTDTSHVGVQAVGNKAPQFADYDTAAHFIREQLVMGRPIMVCWTEWGGHWTVVVGYDNRGTADNYDDDLLLMADPYDTTDGLRDGFSSVPLVHFFYNWLCPMTPKPLQLQPYIVVERI